MKKGILAFVIIAVALAVTLPVLAEDAAQEAKPVTELIHLKYYSGGRMMALIRTYLSQEGHVTPGPDDKILAISDHPENIARILRAIAEVDIKPADLLFTVQLVLGSEEEGKGAELMPASDPIIKELRSLLKYDTYSLLDTSVMRALDSNDAEIRLGERAEFALWLKPKFIKDEKSSLIQLEVRLTRITLASPSPNANAVFRPPRAALDVPVSTWRTRRFSSAIQSRTDALGMIPAAA